MSPLTPCLWFDGQAEDAARFYASVFPDSELLQIRRCGEGMPMPAGSVLTIQFKLRGQTFMGLNGGPQHPLTPAVSFMIDCATQAEVDHYWDRLVEGGEPMECGWLKDRFGLCWQVVPTAFTERLGSPDRAAVDRMFGALFTQPKPDVAALVAAFEGRA